MHRVASLGRALVLVLAVGFGVLAATPPPEDLPAALERGAELARSGQFTAIIDLLGPFEALELGDEARYALAAELGRAYFHSGNYSSAHRRLQTAVRLRPQRVETALYLEATSYVLGQRRQAMQILDSVLSSGAHDLWLANTLPGESRFLADPEVWRILQAHALPLPVDLDQAAVLGARLDATHEEVARALQAAVPANDSPVLSAEAGPHTIWEFAFAAETQRLETVVLYADLLLRYTPYRIDFGHGLDWRATPAHAMAVLGEPVRRSATPDGRIVLRWLRESCSLELGFAVPRHPRPPILPASGATLAVVIMDRHPGR